MARKRKKKIRWSGIALVAAFFAGVVVGLYFLISAIVGWVSGWFSDETYPTTELALMEEEPDPALLVADSVMNARIEKLVRQSTRLDTTDLALCVYDATTGQFVYEENAQRAQIPASCMKVPTAIAALELLGEDYRFETTLQMRGEMHADTLVGELQLRADNDPTTLSLDSLCRGLRAAGVAAVRGRVSVNLLREDTLSSHPSTKSWDISWGKTPCLLRGRKFVENELKYSLSNVEVSILSDENVPAEGEWKVLESHTTPLKEVLSLMLIHSSNVKAEAVYYMLDSKMRLITDRRMNWNQTHAVESFWKQRLKGAGEGVTSMLHALDDMSFVDGSGLSPQNRLSARLLVEMLTYAWEKESLRRYLIDEGLASPLHATRRGSLQGRMSHERFQNRIFVKTGTMTTEGVSGLEGYIHGKDNHWYIFCILNQRCPVAEGRAFQDAFCKLFCE